MTEHEHGTEKTWRSKIGRSISERLNSILSTRRIVRMATVAALYFVFNTALAPISFGPLQFRVANILMALMFFDVDWCFALAFGVFFANLASPFGPLDWAIMPIVTLAAALVAYYLRRVWLGIPAWALITAAGVSFFPLGIGAGIPFWATFPYILVTQVLAGVIGCAIFFPFRKVLDRK